MGRTRGGALVQEDHQAAVARFYRLLSRRHRCFVGHPGGDGSLYGFDVGASSSVLPPPLCFILLNKVSHDSSEAAGTSGAASGTSTTAGLPSSTSSSISPKPTGTVCGPFFPHISPSLTHRHYYSNICFSPKRIACDDASTYFKSVGWAGADGGSGFDADFTMAAKSERDCCAACRDADKSCAGWVFEANNTFTPCTRLLLKDDNPNKDDKCPQGRVASTTFKDGGEMVAGLGPCSGKAIG